MVEIADGRRPRIFSSPHFLAQSSADIFAQGINVVFALPKGDVEHKFSLTCVFCPECRKLQYRQMPAVQKINYSTAVNRIARQSVGVPTDDTVCLSALNPIEHFVEQRTPRNFCRL